MGMKLSVSLSDEDVEFLDAYAQAHQVASRSGAVQRAIRLLRSSELSTSYAEAFEQSDVGESELWDAAAADGLAGS